MKILVTGGAGFIGSHLVDRLLLDRHEVVVLDNLSTGSTANLGNARAWDPGQCVFRRHDVRRADTAKIIADVEPEVVYHLAAQADVRVSLARPEYDAAVNIVGSLHVFEGAARVGVRKVVLAGSGGTLYGVPDDIPTGENHPQRPVCPYGVAKKAAGDYLHYYREITGLDSTILALANVYGPRQDPHGEAGVVAIFGKALLQGATPTIYGDGRQTRDFVFVSDVVDAFVRAAHGGSGVLANVGTGRETSITDLFAMMAAISGFSGKARHGAARPGEVRRSALDPRLIGLVLGWTPATPLPVGLEQTMEWIRSDLAQNGRAQAHRPASTAGRRS